MDSYRMESSSNLEGPIMTKANPKKKSHPNKFPLTLHPTGQYCKKIGGKLYYFGTDKSLALQKYLEQASDLHAGRGRTPGRESCDVTVKELCNLYLDHQQTRAVAGEIKLGQVYDVTISLRDFAKFIGPARAISGITTLDLQNYRTGLIRKGKSATRINNQVSAFKAMYHWAQENEVIDKVPSLTAIKKLPNPKKPRPVFTPDDIVSLLKHADRQITAMIWLGLNCGFGCTDCSELLWKHVDLEVGRISFPRPKTQVPRNFPLWAETIGAMKALTRQNNRVFDVDGGQKCVRFEERSKSDGTIGIVKIDRISSAFKRLMKEAGIDKGKGVGFYTLRRTAATLAARSGDPFAVQKLLGHADLKMAATYVQDVSEQTDRVINNTRKLIIQDDS